MTLPTDIRLALASSLEGISRNDLARRAARLSQTYRMCGPSAAVVSSAQDALAYAVARMPATYAAVRTALSRASQAHPGLRPRSLLDLGSGPGTASFAALEVWPDIEHVTMVDANARFRELAAKLNARSGREVLARADILAADLRQGCRSWPDADLVVASYVLVETREVQAQELALTALARARQGLVLVEPGTPAGFGRIRKARRDLIDQGAFPVAPCPHAHACPMQNPDWCHFSVRLARSRDHKLAKSADAPFEDERFSYVAVSVMPVHAARGARLIAPPRIGKGEIVLRTCGAEGISERRISRRNKSEYKAVKRLGWGEVVSQHDALEPQAP